ncbi:MAG TPA: aromatic ring-hydroxylating dioxygenase subunit alpha [Sphingomonadales bacterium]|nr:aromatic ring-hydroxylating dioxygenase subunit alpha [Sphingomonadales bacterium]
MAKNLKNQSLPAWVYHDPDFFALERERIFLNSWQLVCHDSNIPNAGDYVTFDLLGEMAFVVRGEDGRVRAFHNVCRHRASRLLPGPSGNCKRIRCPYHAWGYDLEGNLNNVPFERDFVGFQKEKNALFPVSLGTFEGFHFIRFKGKGPTLAEVFKPYRTEIKTFRFKDLQPQGRVSLRTREVNWKTAIDNYVDALHIEVAHPGLTGLFGNTYSLEVKGGMHRLGGSIVPTNKETWSVKLYKKYLPKDMPRKWTYYRVWPNLAFDIYPDQMDFMQFLPLSPTQVELREIAYVWPDARREVKACRYLNWRINRNVNLEDKALIEGVQAGMGTSRFQSGPLASREICLIDAAEQVRKAIPAAKLGEKPAAGRMKKLLEAARHG